MTAPKYQRVADDIREKIRTGKLKSGDKLPTTNELIAEYGVSYGSIRGAMLILRAENLIEGRQGEGVYVK